MKIRILQAKGFWAILTPFVLSVFIAMGLNFIVLVPNQSFATSHQQCTSDWVLNPVTGEYVYQEVNCEGGEPGSGDEQFETDEGGAGGGGGGGSTTLLAPDHIVASQDFTCGTGIIHVSWGGVSEATSYTVIDSGEDPYGGEAVIVYTGPNNQTSHSSLASNSTHHYYVSASNSSQTSDWTGPAYAVAPADCPSLDFYADAVNIPYNTSTTLNWSSVEVDSCSAFEAWSGPKPLNGSESTGNLLGPSAYTYTLTCTDTEGTSLYEEVTVNVGPPYVYIVVNSNIPTSWTINRDSTSGSGTTGEHTLLWSNSVYEITPATQSGYLPPTVTNDINGDGNSFTLLFEQTGTFNITYTPIEYCPDGSEAPGNDTANCTVSLSLGANPSNVAFDGTSTLTWSSNNATNCTASGAWSGTKALNGNESTGNLEENSTYTLSCTGPGGVSEESVTITVIPSVTLNADPASVVFNGISTLTWSSDNATSCTASGAWSGAKALDGSESTGNLEADSTYTLTCTGPGGSSQDSATVTVGTPPLNTPTNLTATAVSDSQIDLSWSDNSNGEQGFKIERKMGAGGTWSQIHVTGNNVESYENTGLFADTTYYYRVRATNNNGDSAYSNEASATTSPSPAEISVDVTPNTASWTITPGNIQRTGDDTVTVNPSGEGTGYTITPGPAPSGYEDNPTITNSQGGGSSITLFGGEEVSFTITYERSFDYSLSNGGNISVQKGGGAYIAYGQTTITKTLSPTSGPTQSVDLSVSGLPSGVTIDSISSPTCSPTCTSTLTLAVSSSAPTGTHPITVIGSPLGRTTNFNLIIENSPDLFVSCESTPSSAQVGQNVSWMANVTQNPPESPYTFYWTGTNVPTDPAPSTQSFNIVYTTTGVKNVDVLVTDSKGKTGTCSPLGSINIGVTPIFEEF